MSSPPSSGSSQRKWVFILVGCLAGLCALAACAIVLVLLMFTIFPPANPSVRQPFASSSPTGLPTPSRAISTPAVKATQTPAASSRSATPTPLPAEIIKIGKETLPVKQMVLVEDFSTAPRDWKEERVEGLYMYLMDGEYYVEVRGVDTGTSSLVQASSTPITSDFALLISARAILDGEGDFYGLTYADNATGEEYLFAISGSGHYGVQNWARDGDGVWNWHELVEWQETGAIKPAGDDANALAFVRRGAVITLYLNGQKLHSFEDTRKISPDQVGIYVGAGDEPAAVTFDDLYLATLK